MTGYQKHGIILPSNDLCLGLPEGQVRTDDRGEVLLSQPGKQISYRSVDKYVKIGLDFLSSLS